MDCPSCPNTPCKTILLVDDEPTILVSLRDSLKEFGAEVLTATTADEALSILKEKHVRIVISDVRMPGLSGMDLLAKIREMGLDTFVILMTAYSNAEHAVAAIKMGAHDYIIKPFAMEKMVRAVQHLCDYICLRLEVEELRSKIGDDTGEVFPIGNNRNWLQVLEKVKTVAPTDSTVLIAGASGTGKELIANALHAYSRRKAGPFIKVHCAALPKTLIESELFGHEKGAFTGASRQSKGRFELADAGTILLDEVDEIPLEVQVKLLRVLQEQVVERLGSARPIPINVRVLATTKTLLEKLVERGEFREDLFYRISVVGINLPPLLERRDDIPLLIERFLSAFRKRMEKNFTGFTPEATEALMNYDYPGNVRELEHVVESACALCQGELIGLDLLPESIRKRTVPGHQYRVGFHDRPLAEAMKEFERSYLEHALREFDGNKTELARRLGISRKNLWQKLKEHGIEEKE